MDYNRTVAHTASTGMESTSIPTSDLLSDRLRQCRLESKRSRRRTDFGPSSSVPHEDLFLAEAEAHRPTTRLRDNSPATASNLSRHQHGQPRSDDGTIGSAARKTPGIREMDEKLETLEKLNFDLKMEVFHRRQREKELQKQLNEMAEQVARVHKLQSEHAELLQINDTLVKELERRDEAVKEAVELILDLEGKNEILQEQLLDPRPSAGSDSGYGGLETPKVILPSSPPAHIFTPNTPHVGKASVPISLGNRPPPRNRVPSFISDGKPSTQALRDAYLDPASNLRPVKSFMSILSERESIQGEISREISSPRLSVLSESSFPSIYGKARTDATAVSAPREEEQYHATNDDEYRHFDQQKDSIKRVSTWMDDKTTPPQPTRSKLNITPSDRRSHSKTPSARSVHQPGLAEEVNHVEATSVHELGPLYAGYPTGGSIDLGTPSRFQTRHVSPSVNDMTFDGDGIEQLQRSQPERRKSSAEMHTLLTSINRPTYQRAETSPQTPRVQNPAVRAVHESTRDSPCLLYTSPSPRDGLLSRMPSSA